MERAEQAPFHSFEAFPTAAAHEPAPPVSTPAPDARQLLGIRVLLVEDSPDNQVLYKRVLESSGANVRVADNGQEGVVAALSEPFDVILMDVQMPVLGGREATAKLRESGCLVPVIGLSAHATREERERCISAGFDDYCTKPIASPDLCQAVRKWCEVGRQRMQSNK